MKATLAFTLFAILAIALACHKQTPPPPDRPRLAANVQMQDVRFHSAALGRDMTYRVFLPVTIPANEKFPVVYLLHGGGGSYRDWSNYSDVSQYAARGLILVMPEGESSYYMNAVKRPADRFEDYIVKDLIADVEKRFPVLPDREHRAIVGNSMGGFGAVVLALKHPDLFVFAGALSPALDVPTRPFSIKRIGQYREHSAIFGDWGSQPRRDNDPYTLARNADPARVPYLFLTCGNQEGLLPANKKLAAILQSRGFRYEFYVVPGGHDWSQWNARVSALFESLAAHGLKLR